MTKTRMFLAMVVATTRLASAQPGTVAPAGGTASPDDPSAVDPPGFVTIERLDASSRIGIDLSYIMPDRGASFFGDGTTLLRAELSARYVDPSTALGGYVQVPLALGYASASNRSDTVTDLGNVEIGGIYAPRIVTPDFRLVLHAGITLPTGETGEDELAAGLITSVARLSEFMNSFPQATTLKLGVSPVFRSGALFARVNLGFERNLDVKNGTLPDVVHLDAGAGADLGGAAVMLELANLMVLDEQRGGTTSKGFTLNELAVSARWPGRVSPFAAVVVPLDDDLGKIFKLALTAGAEFAF